MIESGWCCLCWTFTVPELGCPCGSNLGGLLVDLALEFELAAVVVDPLADVDVAALVVTAGAIDEQFLQVSWLLCE